MPVRFIFYSLDSNATEITQELIGPVERAAIIVSTIAALLLILKVLVLILRCRVKRTAHRQAAENLPEPERVLTEKEDQLDTRTDPLISHCDEKQENITETTAATTSEDEGVICRDNIAKVASEDTFSSESDVSKQDKKSCSRQADSIDTPTTTSSETKKSKKTEKALNYIEVDIMSEKPTPSNETKASRKKGDTVNYSTVLVEGSAPPTILDPVREAPPSTITNTALGETGSVVELGTQHKDFYDL